MIKINRKYLPSKKFLTALSIAVGVILITIILNYWKSNTSVYKNGDLTSDNNTTSSIVNIDSDNDGLPDWKEALYGTDPKKADTDGDGTSDLNEISQDRDPLIANTAKANQEPNDKIDPAIIEENKKALEDYQKLNEFDKFSRNLFSNIIASQPVSGSMDQSTIDSIAANAFSEIPDKNYTGITKSTDLNLQKTDSTNLQKNMTTYRTNYYTETENLKKILGKDLNLINLYLADGSTTTRLEMLKITDKYQNVVNNLIKMPVPVAIGYYDINYHLTIINDLEKMIAIDKDIVNSSKDSLSIFSNLSAYSGASKDLFTNLITVDNILKIKR